MWDLFCLPLSSIAEQNYVAMTITLFEFSFSRMDNFVNFFFSIIDWILVRFINHTKNGREKKKNVSNIKKTMNSIQLQD